VIGLNNNNARMHVELNREPSTIEEAVHYVVRYFEAFMNTNAGTQQDEDRHQRTRQVKSDKRDDHGNDQDVGPKKKNKEAGRQREKKTEELGQSEQTNKAEMIYLNKSDLRGILREVLVGLKDQLQDSSSRSQLSGKPGYNENRRKIICFTCQQPGHISKNCPQKVDRRAYDDPRGFRSAGPENQTTFNTSARDFIPREPQQLNYSGSAQ
jgi:hypothetical protein